jgi:hypothetical protein
LNYLYASFEKMGGRADLVAYFFRRDFQTIKHKGFVSLISTNTIAQGDTREGGLEYILDNDGVICNTVKSIKWPGLAAVEVSLISIFKGFYSGKRFLNNVTVDFISSFLSNNSQDYNPYQLNQNQEKAFEGYYLLGNGFIINKAEADSLIRIDSKNLDVLFPYFNGQELNSSFDLNPTKYAINFDERTLEQSKAYPECIKILEERLKPERDKKDRLKYPKMVDEWWLYWRSRQNMRSALKSKKVMMAQVIVSKTHAPVMLPINFICSNSFVVYALDLFQYSFIMCSFHEIWAWKYSSTMKTDRSYSIKDAFETFPFPQNLIPQQELQLETIGEAYHEHRRQLMLGMQLGLTKTYNLFHDKGVSSELRVASGENSLTTNHSPLTSKNLEGLKKHLEKTANTISFDEAIQGILKLRELHVQMDEAVLSAYGWSNDELKITNYDNASEAVIRNSQLKIDLKHDFYEVDYLPENDRVRFTIHPDARKEVLKRLLELNHKIHEEEKASGLLDKKKTVSKKSNVLNEPQAGYGGNLFNQEN